LQEARQVAKVTVFPIPEVDFASDSVTIEKILNDGVQICFTGSAMTEDRETLERSQLERMATESGLKPVKSVTKKCAAVIAADTASMSGKAKKARDSGVPVFSVGQFLDWKGGT
jgi:ATP-dependent DNA helicase PIF1